MLLRLLRDGMRMSRLEVHKLHACLNDMTNIVVFFNQGDVIEDATLFDLVELEVRDTLTAFQFNGGKTSAVILRAAIQV
jgi:translation elongation factor EF-Tu-like GTPase